MILGSWLPIQNMALFRLGVPAMVTGSETAREAVLARDSTLWNKALEKALLAYDWEDALFDVFLGDTATLLSPVLPGGMTEASDSQLDVYAFPIPSYSATDPQPAGTVNFEILKVVAVYPETTEWIQERRRILVGTTPIVGVNHYATVIKKISYAEASYDPILQEAIALALAGEISRSIQGKDQYSESVIRAEFQAKIREAISRGNSVGHGNEPAKAFWRDGVNTTSKRYSWQEE